MRSAATIGLAAMLFATLSSTAAGAAGSQAASKADVSITPSVNAPDIGSIVPGSLPTTFHVDASTGAVTKVAGNGYRLTTTGVTPPTVTITCTGGGCSSSTVTITVSAGGSISGRQVTVTKLYVAALSGATYLTPPSPSGASPLTFTLNPLANHGTATFRLGMDAQFAVSGPTGLSTWSYALAVTEN